MVPNPLGRVGLAIGSGRLLSGASSSMQPDHPGVHSPAPRLCLEPFCTSPPIDVAIPFQGCPFASQQSPCWWSGKVATFPFVLFLQSMWQLWSGWGGPFVGQWSPWLCSGKAAISPSGVTPPFQKSLSPCWVRGLGAVVFLFSEVWPNPAKQDPEV